MMNAMPSHQVRLARLTDIPEGEGREFRVGKRYVAIFRHDDQFYALDDMCPHAGAPLNNGPLCEGTVTCLWHGWRFNLHDGACLTPPRGRDVSTYPVSVRGRDLYVTLPADDVESS